MEQQMKKKQIFALLLSIFLILLPVTFAEIQRSTLMVYGKDNVPGFVRQQDKTFVNATVRLTGDMEITPNQILINNVPFTTCLTIEATDRFFCILQPSFETFLSSGTRSYTVLLKDDNGIIKDTASVSFTVDANIPSVSTMTITPAIIGTGDALVRIAASDAIPCSGISTIGLSVDGQAPLLKEFTDMQQCATTAELSIPNTLFSTEGSHQLCAMARDHLGQASAQKCSTLVVDRRAPVLRENTFQIQDNNGNAVSFLRPPVSVKVIAEFEDALSAIASEEVRADLSRLNGNTAFANRLGTCTATNEKLTRCVWTNVPVTLSEDIQGVITFRIKDAAENSQEIPVSFSLNIDTLPPIAETLMSDHNIEGIPYLAKEDNTLILTIQEAGSGLHQKQVFLNLASTGNNAHQAPDECTQTQGVWQCLFRNIDVTSTALHGRTLKITTTTDSRDDVGNLMPQKTFDVKVDNRPPRLINEINATGSDEDNLFVSGEFITVSAGVEDDLEVSASGNFSALIEGLDEVAGTCEKTEGGIYQCSWQEGIGPLRNGKITKSMKMTFIDEAGNTLQESKTITVYGTDSQDTPDYIQARIKTPSPEAVDRRLMELTHAFIAFPITLDGGDTALPISVEYNDCVGEGMEFLNNAEPYGNKPRLIKTENPKEIFLEFSFDQQSYSASSLNISCSLKVVSLVNNQQLSGEEIENISINIPFYNAPFGELSENVKQKQKDVVEGFMVDSLKWIESLETVVSYAEKLCGIYSTIQNAMFVLAKITTLWGDCCGKGGIYSDAACCPGQQASATQLAGTKEHLAGTYSSIKKFCAITGCTAYSGQWEKATEGKDKTPVLDTYFNWARDKNLPIAQYRSNKGWLGNVEPRESLILSAAFFCVPGVIHNLQKYRSVQCQYVECLQNTKNGMPIATCEAQKDYMTCKHVLGEIFNLVPFAAAFSQIAKNVDAALKNPLNTISTTASAFCSVSCRQVGTGSICETCSWTEFASITKDVLCDLGLGWEDRCNQGLFRENPLSSQDSVCERVITTYEEEQAGGAQDATP